MNSSLPRGIVPVVQTPFTEAGAIDVESLERLLHDTRRAGAAGFLAPAVASEVDFLSPAEREQILRVVAGVTGGQVPFIAGASSRDSAECSHYGRLAEKCGAAAWVVAVPLALYDQPEDVLPFFTSISRGIALPLIIQDLQWNGAGLAPALLARLKESIPSLVGVKIETVPAGPKYSAVRDRLGKDFHIAAGWAITQMIEALDRGVDALVPECSMVAVYSAIYRTYLAGDRAGAIEQFRHFIPVLTFTNQEIGLSIAFFKRLLVRKGVFRSAAMRQPWVGWDPFNSRIADELISLYLSLEQSHG